HLVVRVHPDPATGQRVTEIQVPSESRHWFIRVERAGVRYVAELGYPRPDGKWATIATSDPAVTPPDTAAEDGPVRFANARAEAPANRLTPQTGEMRGPSEHTLIQGE